MPLSYAEINARAVNALLSTKKHVTSIDPALKAMVELRVSQINGCAYCIARHAGEARAAGVPQRKLDCLSVAAESGLFSADETAALRWVERVTDIAATPDIDDELERLLARFDERRAVDLTLTASLMGALNRLVIALGDRPPAAEHRERR